VSSPAHRQYLAIKGRYPDAILLFRMGDFYEMFGEDAEVGAKALQITLTSREFARGDRVAMAGIPHHALQTYLKRFVDQGFKVAICEQLTEPGKGLVERDVVRVVTPGTLIEPGLLEEGRNNYLAAVNLRRNAYGLAFVDVTTGEFAVTELGGPGAREAIETEVLRLDPAECLVSSEDVEISLPGHLTVHDGYQFDSDTAHNALCRHFGVASLEGFGCEDLPAGVGAAGAVLSYVGQSNRSLVGLLASLRTYSPSSHMTLDRYTLRNLELLESTRSGEVRGSLLWVLDRTETAMGARLLRRVAGQPLLEVDSLNGRLDAVEELVELPTLRARIRSAMSHLADLERLTGRVCQGAASAHDLIGLAASLRTLPEIAELVNDASAGELRRAHDGIDPCEEIAEEIERAIVPPAGKKVEGPLGDGLIRDGYSAELDELKGSIRESREWIAGLEAVESETTGIKSLKVGYNKVFGYYIEISNSNRVTVPDRFVRKQTLVNAERYITPELKEHESRILQAEERISSLERKLFLQLLEHIATHREQLFSTAGAISWLDLYRSLADVAGAHRYVRPQLDDGDVIEIEGGRHPVVEITLRDTGFIPNDCRLDCDREQILLITGPNMGGKSTYLRQVALIVLMAQIGSFVPADRASIGLVDRIFTRVGAQDDIAAGQSTFMVEMLETANILNHATRRSLLVLDEVGRGTSTYDGLAIARAVLEHIHERLGARTLFATHYHELTALADRLPRVHNAHAAVTEEGTDVVFLHRIAPGGADRSYGIHVARLAGLPAEVTRRAEEALLDLESSNGHEARGRRRPVDNGQLSLFAEPGPAKQVLDELLRLDLQSMTPLEALSRLFELQETVRSDQ
jgi:DNA mismatch repair protein MutS